ncbi:MAG: carboxymuconolactone decarboxylase family protein [Ginsengibacter sp.]|jgi:uncharacterized peroxidase-related enzyme
MPYIPLESHLPGITGLLEYRKDSGQPIRELTQILMRGESTLTEGERELIASVVSTGNQCTFCSTAHTAAADLLLGNHETSNAVKKDIDTAPVSEKMKALLTIASLTREGGKYVTGEAIENAKAAGATDIEIHDTVLIAALFCLYNRYVDGLATALPAENSYFDQLAERLVNHGYMRLPQGYDHLKNNNSTFKNQT